MQPALAASVSRNINIPVALLYPNIHLLRLFLHKGQLLSQGRDIKSRNPFDVFGTVSGICGSNSENTGERLDLLTKNLSMYERMRHGPRLVVGRLDVDVLDTFLHSLQCLCGVSVLCSNRG